MKKKIIIGVIIACVLFGAGYYLNDSINSDAQCDSNKCYQEGWNAAKDRFRDSGYYNEELITAETPITSVVGTIQNVNNDEIILNISLFDPLSDPELDQRIVKIDKNTKIYKISKKDEAEYQEEVDKFWQDHPEYKDMPDAPIGQPTRYAEELISKNELKNGERIVVDTTKNIRDQKSFTAKKIIVQL